MARKTEFHDQVIPESRMTLPVEIYTCDGCGKQISPDAIEPEFANVLEIYLNIDQCVNHRFRRDLCTACLLPIWLLFCLTIEADPDDTSGKDFETSQGV